MLKEQIDSLLDRVQKPARYMGGEMNCVLKDPNSVDIRYAFAFPDVYEVGMSHLGSRILYDIINKREDALCERVFMPWVDMADLMRQEGVPLFSLETRSPIGGFDMLGVTLQYEMSYTNILEMLDLAGIPLRSEDRTWDHPIVIAGGPCAFNPEPLYAFIDAFSIGDGEISTLETIDVVKQCKQEGVSREECLRRLSRLHGVYVPSLYRASYNEDGTLASFEPTEEGVPRTVVKNMIANIDTAAYPENIIVPFMEIVHDRINIEVLRGCTRGCRFCQAGMIYRPVRERSVEHLLELAQKLVDSTGYEEITLSSLSTGDYTCLPELAHKLMDKFQEERIALSCEPAAGQQAQGNPRRDAEGAQNQPDLRDGGRHAETARRHQQGHHRRKPDELGERCVCGRLEQREAVFHVWPADGNDGGSQRYCGSGFQSGSQVF
ncbi:MAG: TIGR03960 family B12-binding radical SAM protein [Christensenellales bacterium]